MIYLLLETIPISGPGPLPKGLGVVSLVAGGRLHACVAHDSYHSLGEIGTDGTCGVGSLSFFVSGWMEGQEAVKDVAFYFLLGV